MLEYLPLKAINVTNKFPSEQASLGLNYYIPIETLPLKSNDLYSWNILLSNAYYLTQAAYGFKTFELFTGHEWAGLNCLSECDRDRLDTLGYNIMFRHNLAGPMIWGNRIQGSEYSLPALMTSLQVIKEVQHGLDSLIQSRQLELFHDMNNQQSQLINRVLCEELREYAYKLQCERSSVRELAYMTNITEYGWSIRIDISLEMHTDPITLLVEIYKSKKPSEYYMPTRQATVYAMIDSLWGTGALQLKDN